MTVLITYPRLRVPRYLRLALEQQTNVLYWPLRVLKPVTLSVAERTQIHQAKTLAVTSHFGAKVFLKRLRELNKTAPLYVLSTKIASLLDGKVTNPIIVSSQSNRQSLAERLVADKRAGICWLVSNLAVDHYQDLPGELVVVYNNIWGPSQEKRTKRLLLRHPLDRVVVTSGSNYQRLMTVLRNDERLKKEHPTYYVLGVSTGRQIEADGERVVYPSAKSQVLEGILKTLLGSEIDERDGD